MLKNGTQAEMQTSTTKRKNTDKTGNNCNILLILKPVSTEYKKNRLHQPDKSEKKRPHVEKANATRGIGKVYTWKRQSLHVEKAKSTRGIFNICL